MSMLLISGEYRITGTAPDGDSVRFYADDPSLWAQVGGAHPVHVNAAGGAQLRLDAIDALETHFAVEGATVHQPLALAHAARDALLTWVGFTRVDRDGSDPETVTGSDPASVRGYVLTGAADDYGRCIAFAGRGAAPAGGPRVHVTPEMVRATANHELLATGLAYPTYYRGLYPDLRLTFTAAVEQARAGAGLWPQDTTQSGLPVRSLAQLQESGVVLPKLFRRLTTWLALNGGDPSLSGFPAYLDAQGDKLYILPTGHYTGLSTVVEVSADTPGRGSVRLTYRPEDLLFDEK
jgi:hypothetical protein